MKLITSLRAKRASFKVAGVRARARARRIDPSPLDDASSNDRPARRLRHSGGIIDAGRVQRRRTAVFLRWASLRVSRPLEVVPGVA